MSKYSDDQLKGAFKVSELHTVTDKTKPANEGETDFIPVFL